MLCLSTVNSHNVISALFWYYFVAILCPCWTGGVQGNLFVGLKFLISLTLNSLVQES